MRIRGDLPGDGVVTSGKIHKVEVVNKYGNAMTQAEQGEQIQWKITFSVVGTPAGAYYGVIFEIPNPDKPGTTWTGIRTTAYGDGRIMTKISSGILMPSHDIRYYITMWDANWKLLAESPVQTLRYTPPAPPPEPEPAPYVPPETQPPAEIQPTPIEPAPPEKGPPPKGPLKYLIWLLFG